MIDDGYFRSCLVSVYYLGLGDATVYLHALGVFFWGGELFTCLMVSLYGFDDFRQ